jgi:hypothetical protein
MKKHARGKRRGRGQVARRIGPLADATGPAAPTGDSPIVLSITPDGATLPDGADLAQAAQLRRQLDQHARDVEEFVRAQRFNAIVTRVLADVKRPDPGAPPLRLRR